MKVFKNNILVFKVWKSGNKQVELCFFPPFKIVGPHSHRLENIEIMHLFGRAYYHRKIKEEHRMYKATTFKDFGKCFSVPASAVHWAFIGWCGLVILSIQKWTTEEVKSVTEDYYEEKLEGVLS